jgi:[ribosomal protein S18]-alanine N-acetyltransferase
LSTPSAPVPIQIRKMTLTDLPRVIEIDRQSFSLPWPQRSFEFEAEKNESARAWVAESEAEAGKNVIVGMVVAWLIIDEIHIATVATAPEFRRQGIGRKLMVHVLKEAFTEGAITSYLEVRRGNEAAREMYRSLGYQEDGIRPHYYQDNHEDAILMSLKNINLDLLNSYG